MKVFCLQVLLAIFGISAFAQHRFSGRVVNEQSQAVAQANVQIIGTSFYVATDSTGHFHIDVPNGNYQLQISAIGYHTLKSRLRFETDLAKVFRLHSATHELKEVAIVDKRAKESQREENLNKEVVKADFIQRHLGGSLMKSLERLPGVKTIGIGSGQSKPLIRGLGFNRVVVLDRGVKHEGQQWGADHGLEIDQFAAGEVALIKGSASFMYGSDAIGGAIEVKPIAPPAIGFLGGEVNLIGKTNNNLYGLSANIAGRKEKWFFDARATYQSYGDYRVPTDKVYVYDFVVDLDNSYLRNTAGTETGLHFNTGYLGEHFKSVFYVSNTYSKSGFFANAHGLEPRRVDLQLHDASSRDIQMPNQEVNHFKVINRSEAHFGNHKLFGDIGFQRNFRQEFSPYVNHGFMPAVYPSTLGIPSNLEREFDKTVFSLNLRDEITLAKHQLNVGLNAEHQDNGIGGWGFLVPAFTQQTLGFFAYDKYQLNTDWALHGALRFDVGQLDLASYRDWFPSKPQDQAPFLPSDYLVRAQDLTRTFNSLTWSVGANFNKEHFSVKANIGKSFRMPIAKELGANGVNYHYFSYEKGNVNLDPEQSYQFDLGLGWHSEKLQVQLSPFFNYFPNYIYLNPTANHDYFYGAGNQVFEYSQSEVMRYGGELQVNYRFAPQWSTEFLGEYLYAEQWSGAKQGFTLPFSPPPSALFNLTYHPELGGKFASSYIGLDFRVTAPQNNIVPPEKKTAGYQVFNLQAGTKLNLNRQPLVLSLQVQNLFDTKYFNHTSFYRLIELPEAGRNVVLSVKVPFQINK